MPLFERHVFVCTNERPGDHPRGCCAGKDALAIREALKAATKAHGLKGVVRVNAAGWLDQCDPGVTLVVYPEAVWYGFVTPADVPEIVESHLLNGQPVERLRLAPSCLNTPNCLHRS